MVLTQSTLLLRIGKFWIHYVNLHGAIGKKHPKKKSHKNYIHPAIKSILLLLILLIRGFF